MQSFHIDLILTCKFMLLANSDCIDNADLWKNRVTQSKIMEDVMSSVSCLPILYNHGLLEYKLLHKRDVAWSAVTRCLDLTMLIYFRSRDRN